MAPAGGPIHNRVRGLQPWPGAYTAFAARRCTSGARVTGSGCRRRVRPAALPHQAADGRCGEGALELIEVQLEGRKRMPAADFANGQRLTENEILGERPLNLPLGYLYSATYAGIRQAEKDDLALIVSGLPANAAAVFTQNRVQAAPVRLCRARI